MKLTPWYFGMLKPRRAGWYDVLDRKCDVLRRFFIAGEWRYYHNGVLKRCENQSRPWRGIWK